MASEVGICNQGLLLLGASQITSLNENSVNAQACKLIFEDTRDSLLRTYPWKFAIRRVQIIANVTVPVFGRGQAYDLPGDYISLLPPYPEDDIEALDWIIEGNQIITDDSSPLDLRYISRIDDPDCMDPLFRKAFSAAIAVETAEQITQSNTKLANVVAIFKDIVTDARQQNAFEAVNHLPPLDEWISVRQRGRDNTKTFFP